MKIKSMLISVGVTVALGVMAAAASSSAQDKYSLTVPSGLAFSEFKGYDTWQTVSISHNGDKLAAILGNPAMIAAFRSGIPGNGKPFPDGAKMAKIHWTAKKAETEPGQPPQANDAKCGAACHTAARNTDFVFTAYPKR